MKYRELTPSEIEAYNVGYKVGSRQIVITDVEWESESERKIYRRGYNAGCQDKERKRVKTNDILPIPNVNSVSNVSNVSNIKSVSNVKPDIDMDVDVVMDVDVEKVGSTSLSGIRASDKIPPLQQHFKNLWNNTLVPWYRSKFPLSPPISQITTKSLKNLSARDRELKGLVKELIADGVVKPEDVGNDVWRWAFACVADRIAKSSFLRGECRPDDNHRQFVFSVDYFLRPSAFIKLVSPLSKYCLDDKGGGL